MKTRTFIKFWRKCGLWITLVIAYLSAFMSFIAMAAFIYHFVDLFWIAVASGLLFSVFVFYYIICLYKHTTFRQWLSE